MELRPFDPTLAGAVASWAGTPEERLAWCSRREVDARIVRGWSDEDDVHAFLLVEDDTPVAYGEAWVDDEEGEVELARLVVRPDRRGEGIGRGLVEALVAHAHALHPLATMRVVPGNTAARRCYAAAGFTRVSPEEEQAWNAGQPTAYVWMVRPRPSTDPGRDGGQG
jgi:ribosomal-protein-alanine N-acetyltransferase